MTVKIKAFSDLSAQDLYEILKARFAVFVMEQHCFYLDIDNIDYRSLHLYIDNGIEVIAYARLFPEDEPGAWHVGRLLTTQRGQGLGMTVLRAVIEEARKQGGSILRMDAQTHAIKFYERFGFRVCSREFEEAGIMHVKMELSLEPIND